MLASPSQQSERPAKRERVAALATLPLFWPLKSKRVLVAGGSDAAAWKAELLSACGAEVHVYAPRAILSDLFLDVLARGAAHELGRFVHHDKAWHADAFRDAAIAIADCDEQSEAEAFFHAARTAGVPVNVIDKPAFCEFQFGSIVNRSPVIVAISTDGAAPILAQAIRRRIEALLPPALKHWASIAQAIRDRVNARLSPGAARRIFWERFVDRAFLGKPEQGVEMRLMAEADRQVTRPSAIGRVTIVGAGPGDAELLTLKAVRALQAADVILFDECIQDEVLELARREARRVPVAGSDKDRSSSNAILVQGDIAALVRKGKNVVRLQSGNPMAVDEEFAAFERLGLPVQIVPGVEAEAYRPDMGSDMGSDMGKLAFSGRPVQPGLHTTNH
ncbi:siroheme synthase [Sinorhizobium medicae]|uniref:siroheme synthase family protein n=1 Tax=Sinorhizobium medicae TaxID=110321 RepID=UPI00129733AC|nr:SAM-dependent methyltransferase [Sinorhizobium medicae]MDX0539420.1 siroheme synthase [Sinorhizobium medicae]MDX0994695.1 siroheme synthase [Sinorhizobium medicae]MDX1178555.1 siroheme synthase [Sinorhizobium medicae]MQY01192.1 siroheme synthase [Sinorhizobium medicae]